MPSKRELLERLEETYREIGEVLGYPPPDEDDEDDDDADDD